MDQFERQQWILDQLQQEGAIAIQTLIERMPASPATIRRDLNELSVSGKLIKRRGKVFAGADARIPAYELRHAMHDEEKDQIGKKAASLVQEGDTIILDAGTTVLALAKHLRSFQNLSVLTNSLPVAMVLQDTQVHVFVCGGMLEDMALLDQDALAFFEKHSADKAFISSAGVRMPAGLTVLSPFHYAMKRQMMEAAREVYGLIDHSKFSTMSVNLFAEFRELTGLVTSPLIRGTQWEEQILEQNVRLIYSEEAP